MKPASCCFFLIPPPLSLLLTPSSLAARGRGCLSSCAPHQERSACTAKELWVSVSLHGYMWQAHRCHSRKTRVLKGSCVKPWFLSGCAYSELRLKAILIIWSVHYSPSCFLLYFVGLSDLSACLSSGHGDLWPVGRQLSIQRNNSEAPGTVRHRGWVGKRRPLATKCRI